MRTLNQWLDAYAVSHQNPINKRIHRVAVPGIYLSIVGLIWSLPAVPLMEWRVTGSGWLRCRFLVSTTAYP